VGSVARRLEALEERRRAEAVAEVTRILEELTDREIALIITWMEVTQDGREPTAEEVAAWHKGQETGVEEIIAAAIGLEESMDEEEVSCRISALAKELEIWQGRESGIYWHLKAIRNGKR
jgi:hypothetical protein